MPPSNRPMILMQTLVDSSEVSLLKIPIKKARELDINQNTFDDFDHARPIGISPGYSSDGVLIALAIADNANCTIIDFNVFPRSRFDKGPNRKSPLPRNLDSLQERILCRQAGELFAFDMAPLCLSIYIDSGLRVTNAVDIQSGLSAVDRKPLTAIKEILGTSMTVKDKNIVNVFSYPVYEPEDRKSSTDLAQRAWISQLLPVFGNGAETLGKVRRIDTQKFPAQKLDILAKVTNDSLRQNLKKPTKTKHNISIVANGQEPTTIVSSRFSNKLRSNQDLIMVAKNASGSQYTMKGQVGVVRGKSGPLLANRSLDGKMVTSVISIGREDPTTAEAQRAATVLRVLQGYGQLMDDSPWIQNIFYPSDDCDHPISWPPSWAQDHDNSTSQCQDSLVLSLPPSDPLPLNPSQQIAVNTMCSPLDDHRITIIQGPPGTGKTSVIASFVQLAINMGHDGIWLIAQSNVAVKNIAEKLLKIGFQAWRLLVSVDFLFEWHEHIYAEAIQNNIIRSDRFKFVSANEIKGCRVMICTLSMLSNMFIGKFTSQNPIKTLVVDEASQIEINNYVSVLATSITLRKMCFIGDDMQLPPFGQEDLQDLQSIFEVPHLRPHALFLDIQYRMPPQIGDIISDLVYEGKLKSNSRHPISNTTIACYFLDTPGQEEKYDKSFMNLLECDAIIKLAQKLQDQQKDYQIITPYEAQRSTIEARMIQTSNLDWKDKCFNVDSFQGNEQDYIIISLVRSRDVGFLKNKRRTNVMLTRCKKGMFIVTSRKFISGYGAKTLVGELAERMGNGAWLDVKDLEAWKF